MACSIFLDGTSSTKGAAHFLSFCHNSWRKFSRSVPVHIGGFPSTGIVLDASFHIRGPSWGQPLVVWIQKGLLLVPGAESLPHVARVWQHIVSGGESNFVPLAETVTPFFY